jgi:hypothetical protein
VSSPPATTPMKAQTAVLTAHPLAHSPSRLGAGYDRNPDVQSLRPNGALGLSLKGGARSASSRRVTVGATWDRE